MIPITRKEFLQSSAVLLASIVAGNAFASGRKQPLLAFSTLGCPDWTFDQITSFAARHGYKGVEVRGLQRQMDLPLCPEFSTADARKRTMAIMKERGLSFVGLGSSANLHLAEGAEREKSLADARRFIDLSGQINCPYVRVFPNNFPKERSREATIDLIVKGLRELGNYARDKKVTVLMETHGEVVKIADLREIMQRVDHPGTALIWDVTNMWTVTKEPPAEAYRALKPYIRHVHIKDARLVEGKPQYTFLGEGDVPIFEAIDTLHKGGYKGYYSFEWEKMWHPTLPETEIAFAHYPKAMKKHFASL